MKNRKLFYSFQGLKTTGYEPGLWPKKIRTKADFFVGPDAKQAYGKPDVPTTFQLCRVYKLFEKKRGHDSQEPEPYQSCPQHKCPFCNSSDSARHLMFWSCVGITLHWISPERLFNFLILNITFWNLKDSCPPPSKATTTL